MSIASVKRTAWRGFTLLEIALAVAILGMMSITIYRFVATNIIVLAGFFRGERSRGALFRFHPSYHCPVAEFA